MKNLKQTLADSLRVIKSTDSTQYVLADAMYTAVSHNDFGYTCYTLRNPSLTRAVVRRLLKTRGYSRTLAYHTNYGKDGNGQDFLKIGCQTFCGSDLKGLRYWAGLDV